MDGYNRRWAGAGNRGKQSASQHAGETKTTIPMSDHRSSEIDHSLRHPAVRQKITGEDKEGNRHDLELLNACEQLERHRFKRHIGHRKEEGQYRQAE